MDNWIVKDNLILAFNYANKISIGYKSEREIFEEVNSYMRTNNVDKTAASEAVKRKYRTLYREAEASR